MPNLDQLNSSKVVKMLLIGDPGAGKTPSLISLVLAGYRLRIWNYDNLLGSLKENISRLCPAAMQDGSVQAVSLTDKMKSSDKGPVVSGTPTAFIDGLKLFDKWEDGTSPWDWDEKTVVVIDSLTKMSDAAFRFNLAMNPGIKDIRQVFKFAQDDMRKVLDTIRSDQFKPNVIVIAHIAYKEDELGLAKGYPRAVGSALGPEIGGNFNAILLAECTGSGTNVKRVLRTSPSSIVQTKNPALFKVPDTLPTFPDDKQPGGLATFFAAVNS